MKPLSICVEAVAVVGICASGATLAVHSELPFYMLPVSLAAFVFFACLYAVTLSCATSTPESQPSDV